jgi:hypothetical protein
MNVGIKKTFDTLHRSRNDGGEEKCQDDETRVHFDADEIKTMEIEMKS